jgi:3-oxoacyl-[acyl-carrier protein] reductase
MKVNVMAPIFLTSGLLNQVRRNSADILTVGSTIGTKSSPTGRQLVYCASKWAIQGVNATLKDSLENTNSRVLLFNPGGMQTRFFDKFKEGVTNTESFMKPLDVAKLMLDALKLPKSVEVSEILINRKKTVKWVVTGD